MTDEAKSCPNPDVCGCESEMEDGRRNSFGEGTPNTLGADRRRTTRLALSLPADAAERLVTLLNSDTPEGAQARANLGYVLSAKLVDKMVDTVADICDANNGGKQ